MMSGDKRTVTKNWEKEYSSVYAQWSEISACFLLFFVGMQMLRFIYVFVNSLRLSMRLDANNRITLMITDFLLRLMNSTKMKQINIFFN